MEAFLIAAAIILLYAAIKIIYLRKSLNPPYEEYTKNTKL